MAKHRPAARRASLAPPSPLGINVSGLTPQANDRLLADQMLMANPWTVHPRTLVGGVALLATLDDAGYPTVDADTGFYLGGGPAGDWTFCWSGSGTVRFFGRSAAMGTPASQEDGSNRATLTVDDSGGALTLTLTGVDPGDPPRGYHLYPPGIDPDDPPPFRPDAIRRYRIFKGLRMMDLLRTNGNAQVDWADRTPPGVPQTGAGGVAHEVVIALAAATGAASIWVNVPYNATDDYVARMAALYRDGLPSGTTTYVEYSNELWNTGAAFTQYHTNVAASDADPRVQVASLPSWKRAIVHACVRAAEIGRIWRATFGADAARVRMVWGGKNNDPGGWAQPGLDGGVLIGLVDPAADFHGIAIAPYISEMPAEDLDGMTVDQVIASMGAYLAVKTIPGVQGHAQLAADYGLALLAYEGGQQLTGSNSLSSKMAAQDDPRMVGLYDALWAAWAAAGGGLFHLYGGVATLYSSFGLWGALPDPSLSGSARWDWAVRHAVAFGDVNLDGVVDAADRAIIAANQGTSGAWWEDGRLGSTPGAVGPDDLAAFDAGVPVAPSTPSAPPPSQSPWSAEAYREANEVLAADSVQAAVFDEIVRILVRAGVPAQWLVNDVPGLDAPSFPYAFVVRMGTSPVVFTSSSDVRRTHYAIRLVVEGDDDFARNRLLSGLEPTIMDALSYVSIGGLTAPGWTEISRVSNPRSTAQDQFRGSDFAGSFCYQYEHAEV